jgi:hypothetical protein
VDIPGLERDSTYTVTIDSSNTTHNSLNYVVDSTSVHIVPDAGVSINSIAISEDKFIIYPNPSNGNATIEYFIHSDMKVVLEIYNVVGMKVAEIINTTQNKGIYKYDLNSVHLTSGVYFIVLNANSKTTTNKIIITE